MIAYEFVPFFTDKSVGLEILRSEEEDSLKETVNTRITARPF